MTPRPPSSLFTTDSEGPTCGLSLSRSSAPVDRPCHRSNDQVEIGDGQLIGNTVSVTGKGDLQVEWESDVSNVSHIPYLVE